MAYVAIILHLAGGSPREEVNNWLRRAMVSDAPEFLINLGEELVIGTAIYRDLQLAKDCFDHARIRSELMGSYAMAQLMISNDRKHSLQCLERAAALGHIPSRHLLNSLLLPRKGLRRLLLALRYLPGLIRQTQRVFRGQAVPLHWWRYKDVFPGGDVSIQAELGDDRHYDFPWARPSSLSSFAAVCTKGEAPTLSRGVIDATALWNRLAIRPRPDE